MQDLVECADPQKHNGESLVIIHCMVLEIQLFLQLFFLIPSSKASCFVEASYLVEDIKNTMRNWDSNCEESVLSMEVPTHFR